MSKLSLNSHNSLTIVSYTCKICLKAFCLLFQSINIHYRIALRDASVILLLSSVIFAWLSFAFHDLESLTIISYLNKNLPHPLLFQFYDCCLRHTELQNTSVTTRIYSFIICSQDMFSSYCSLCDSGFSLNRGKCM